MRAHSPTRQLRRVSVVVGALLIAAVGLSSCVGSRPASSENEVLLGGLYSLTGSWSTLGKTGEEAMSAAIEDINRYLEGNAAGITFSAAVEDTRLVPEVALEKAQALRARGVQLLIGPQSSSEVAYLKDYVDRTGILLVSPSSTAGSLAIAGDNIYRFTPTDSLEGIAVATMAWEDGIRSLVPVYRDDAGNAGLEVAVRHGFSRLGGAVPASVSYAPETANFTATLSELRSRIDTAIVEHGTERVGVYLAAFDEVVQLFSSASDDSVLSSVRWYGSNGVVLSEPLRSNPQAAAFAMQTGYPNPIFGLDEGARDIWAPIVDRIQMQTGLQPDAYALAIYDAVWVIARGYVASGATQDIERLKQAFVTAAASGYGATGWTVLNKAGDRRYGDFDFWAIEMAYGEPHWSRVARFESRIGRLVRLVPPPR